MKCFSQAPIGRVAELPLAQRRHWVWLSGKKKGWGVLFIFKCCNFVKALTAIILAIVLVTALCNNHYDKVIHLVQSTAVLGLGIVN